MMAFIHLKSTKMITCIHPWTALEWRDFLSASETLEVDLGAVLVVDPKGRQFAVVASAIEYVMVVGDDDGK